MRTRRGFTLIELLVVIGIIAMLLSILAPALNKAKLAAEDVLCKSNIHQYHLAAVMFFDDHNEEIGNPVQIFYNSCQGRCPGGTCSDRWGHAAFPGESQRLCRWHNKLYDLSTYPQYAGLYWQYLQSTKVSLCPLYKRIAVSYGDQHPGHSSAVPEFHPNYGYSFNGVVGFGTKWPKSSSIRSPSRVFMWAEENPWALNESRGFNPALSVTALNDSVILPSDRGQARGLDCLGSFHKASNRNFDKGVANVLFFDGSIGWHGPAETKDLAFPPN